MYCQVALLSPPYSNLTYALPEYFPRENWAEVWQIGCRVAIPLGNGAFRVGIITAISDNLPSSIPQGTQVRPLVWPMERKSMLSASYLSMCKQLGLRQLLTEGRILGNVLPQGLRTTKNIRIRQFQENGKPVFFKLREFGALSLAEKERLAIDYLEHKVDVLAVAENTALSERLILTVDPPWPLPSTASKQREILDLLMHQGDISRQKLKQSVVNAEAALKTLLEKGFVKIQAFEEMDEDEVLGEEYFLPPPMPGFALNEDQQKIFDELSPSLVKDSSEETASNSEDSGKSAKNEAKTALLYGVTGSGKTALYLELAKTCLSQGKSVLLLAPEVAIALKLRQDAAQRNMSSVLYHGYQNPRQREKIFKQASQSKDAQLVIGTRSALFLPLNTIGLIILDEEHDDSFKQDEGLHYHAKEIAWYRMQQNGGLFVLGSATPDIKSFYASEQKAYARVEMKKRIGEAILPEVQLVDIKECKQSLAPESVIALKDCLAKGEQAIIMLNRRGYAPLLYCLDCKAVARCPHCDIALSYHKKREQMLCHYCGFTKPFPSPCEGCKGVNFLPLGEGTERLEEDIYNMLTHEEKVKTKILRMDRDSTRREGRMEEILNAFAKQEAQILVGTQMLSKGHHFPNVTLALVIDADLGLNFPDYRAVERTFQLLTQAAGRAGRGEKKGKVLIQTRDIKHYSWDFVRKGDYEAFYKNEIAMRKKYLYPPFSRLALIRASMPKDGAKAVMMWKEFIQKMKQLVTDMNENGLQVKGPSPAPLSFIKGRQRYHCMIKGQNWNTIRQIYAKCLPSDAEMKKVDLRLQLDIDPVNML